MRSCTMPGRCAAAILILGALIISAGCNRSETAQPPLPSSQLKPVTLYRGSITDMLLRIALERGFFRDEGLSMTIKDMPDGKVAFDALARGECNFAATGTPPIVSSMPSPTTVTILAEIFNDDDGSRIIGRRDRGIAKPTDLKGKRIGVKKGIHGHFFLDLFLMKHGMTYRDVKQVFMETDQFIPSLEKGEIDAFSMTGKMISLAAARLGANACVLSEPGLHVVRGVLIANTTQPATMHAAPLVLKALIRAERFAREHPDEAKAIVAKASGLSADEIDAVWKRSRIEVTLKNSLLLAMEDHFTWQQDRGLLPASAKMPNFLTLVSPQYLAGIDATRSDVAK